MDKLDYAICHRSMAKDIEDCGSDHLKLADLVKRIRARATDLETNENAPWAYDVVNVGADFTAVIPRKTNKKAKS